VQSVRDHRVSRIYFQHIASWLLRKTWYCLELSLVPFIRRAPWCQWDIGRADLMQQPTVTPLIHVVPVHAWKPANSPCMLISAVNVPDPWYTSLGPLAYKRPPVLAGPIANKGQCGVTNQDMLASCLRKGVSYLNCICPSAAEANILPCSPTHFLLRLPDTDSVYFHARPHNLPILVHLPTPSSCAALQPSQDTELIPLARTHTL